MNAFMRLPDLEPGEEKDLVVSLLPSGPRFNVFETISAGYMLSNLHASQKETPFNSSHPNLLESMKKRMGKALTEEELLMQEDKVIPLNEYIMNQDEEGMRKILDGGIQISYEPVGFLINSELATVMGGMEI